ncbi:MAG: hypothetical protein HRU19_19290 [Pseudobacteriovorax sp.]|nr:hypothetical protein [Pseudobacteriovorax sp.]
MKRIYTWRDETSGTVVEVQRKMSDYRIPPSTDEIAHLGLKGENQNWIKLVDAALITGNLQKGNYGRC